MKRIWTRLRQLLAMRANMECMRPALPPLASLLWKRRWTIPSTINYQARTKYACVRRPWRLQRAFYPKVKNSHA